MLKSADGLYILLAPEAIPLPPGNMIVSLTSDKKIDPERALFFKEESVLKRVQNKRREIIPETLNYGKEERDQTHEIEIKPR